MYFAKSERADTPARELASIKRDDKPLPVHLEARDATAIQLRATQILL
jgi:hypothetical protein